MAAAQQGWQTLQDASARLPFAVDDAAMQQIWSRVQGVASGGTVQQSALTGTVLMVIVLFFFLQDAERIGGFLLSWFSAPHRGATPDRPGHRAHPGWLRAGHRCGGGDRDARDRGRLWLLGVSLATPLTMLMLLGASIPIVGAALAVPPHGGGVIRGPVVVATARSDW